MVICNIMVNLERDLSMEKMECIYSIKNLEINKISNNKTTPRKKYLLFTKETLKKINTTGKVFTSLWIAIYSLNTVVDERIIKCMDLGGSHLKETGMFQKDISKTMTQTQIDMHPVLKLAILNLNISKKSKAPVPFTFISDSNH